MKVTDDRFKDRQLHSEGYLQMVSTESKEYAEVSACQRIAENNHTITDFQKGTESSRDRLLEKILQPTNLNNAYKKVKSNKGAGGIDGMSIDGLLPFLRDNQIRLIQQLKDGKYKPNPVRRVEIPKERKGEIRKIVLAFDQRGVRDYISVLFCVLYISLRSELREYAKYKHTNILYPELFMRL